MSDSELPRTAENNERDAAGLPDNFPPELLVEILLNLPYNDLIFNVSSVSKEWKEILHTEPSLGVKMFKKAGAVYVPDSDSAPAEELEAGSEEIRMHPLLPKLSFILGHDVSDACIYSKDYKTETSLATLNVANDQAFIPAVHTLTITIEEGFDELFEFQVDVQNSNGITIMDIFTELAIAGKRSVETQEGPMAMSEALGDHVFYEGLGCLKRAGTALTAYLSLGS
ncbi:hypothetical protein C8R43DRAFT_1006495 [Mycena crocata]|nr:hypothetical protein C8R43DRAFT_1006495 [Mycena crocata]